MSEIFEVGSYVVMKGSPARIGLVVLGMSLDKARWVDTEYAERGYVIRETMLSECCRLATLAELLAAPRIVGIVTVDGKESLVVGRSVNCNECGGCGGLTYGDGFHDYIKCHICKGEGFTFEPTTEESR